MSDTLDIIKRLSLFGLSQIESQIYLFLLHKETSSVTEIAKELNLPRTSVYDNSQRLIQKGLVERVLRYKSQLLKASPIEILDEVIEKEKERIHKLDENLKELQKLVLPISSLTPNTQVRYYQGAQGFRQMIWNCLKAENEIVGYSVFGRADVVGIKFYEKYTKEFKLKKLKDRAIFNPNKETLDYIDKFLVKGNHQLKIDDVRYLPEDELYIAGDTSIYNNTFAVCYWKHGEIVGIEIENPEFVKTQKTIFEILWKVSKSLTDL